MPRTLREKTVADVGLTQPLRMPFERWPEATDLGIAAVAFGLTLVMWSSRSGADGFQLNSLLGVATWLLAFVGCFALLWRRSHPLQVHGIVLLMSGLVLIGPLTDGIVALVFSLYSVGRYEPHTRASIGALLAALLYMVIDAGVVTTPSADDLLPAIMAFALWYAGRRLRFRGEYLRLLEERAQHLEREQTLEAERAVAAERTRIAREMHDVVAHQVSLMTVQAGAARTITASDPKAAGAAMAAVETAGRQALSEMRELLGVLRPAQAGDGLAPQPGIADLPELVQQVCDVGPAVRLTTRGPLSGLSSSVALGIYRIVQEALTNVVKHAGDGVAVEVSVVATQENVRVSVVDTGSGADGTKSGGYGIAGMRERVELMHGRFTAGNEPDGGFAVRAVLPRAGAAGLRGQH